MIEKNIICVICPSSCKVCVKGDGQNVESITGYNCERGREYAQQEYTDPKRTLTTTMKAEGYTCPVIAVRSADAAGILVRLEGTPCPDETARRISPSP